LGLQSLLFFPLTLLYEAWKRHTLAELAPFGGRVSVIVPAYNEERTLRSTLLSLLDSDYPDLEIIVVNDGSTEQATREKLATYQRDKTRVLTTGNQGLAAARNNGITAAAGDYILPLDADDRIAPRYLEEAVAVLKDQPETGIVYCQARLFGAVEADWLLPEYSVEEMLRDNVIFCSALFRRTDWQLVGGYDTGMVHGWEDYEFWISLIERGKGVHRLDGRYFYYRVAADSMVRSKEKQQKIEMFKRIYQRHSAFIGEHIEAWLAVLLETRETYHTGRLYVDCGKGLSDSDSIARKVCQGRQVLSFPVETFVGRRSFRFDPSDCPVVVELEAIEVVTGGEKIPADLAMVESNALYRQGNRFFFASADPQLYLPSGRIAGEAIQRIVIAIDIIAVHDEALRLVIAYQDQRLQQKRGRSVMSRLMPFRKRDVQQ
ncbi:MAG: glycosyltransferase family 2 protein, partial [Desulfofustis sp.]|nr:glycosyltransferase family 2 protein [Desulfofustis sp.]